MSGDFNILIAGLGIMGGSLAKALKGFRGGKIYGFDANIDVIKKAESDGVIEKGTTDKDEFLPIADLVIVCLYPDLCIDFINSGKFKPGSVVTDICGVKGYILDNIKNDEIDFLGGHPMAGRELSGYSASVPDLFENASYILTPTDKTSSKAISLMREVADYIGSRQVTITTPENHDAMIAYTSQLMHVVAIALCDNPLLSSAKDYSAGSLRDCTRVANLNATMWSELFMENSDELSLRIDEFEKSMDSIKEFLKEKNAKGLCEFLETAANRKRRFFN